MVMDLGEKEKELLELCRQKNLDTAALKRCLNEISDLNTDIDEEENLLTEVYREFYSMDDQCSSLPVITQLFIDAGFNIKKHGFNCLYAVRYSICNQYALEAAKVILKNGAEITASQWEELLENAGTEESFMSVEGNHKLANLYYAYYELLDRARKGLPFEDILSWESCVGLRVEKVIASSTFRPVLDCSFSSEYRIPGELYFQCGDKTILLVDRPNVFIQDTKNVDTLLYTEDVSEMFSEFIGQEITKVYFEHKKFKTAGNSYRQPNIYIVFSNHAMLHFYTNYGEVEEEDTRILLRMARNLE